MNLSEYQASLEQFAIYPQNHLSVPYCNLGAFGEAGELANQVKKMIRDDGNVLTDERRAKLIDEAGDVLWYIARRAVHEEYDIGDYVPGSLGSANLAEAVMLLGKHVVDFNDYTGYQFELYAEDAIDALNDVAGFLGVTLEDLAAQNVAKLLSRKERNTLAGSGDGR